MTDKERRISLAIVITKRMVSGELAYLVRWEANIERWLTEEDLRP